MLISQQFLQWTQWKNNTQPAVSAGNRSKKAKCLFAPSCKRDIAAPRSGGGVHLKTSGTLANRPAQTEQSVGHKPWRQG